MPGRQVRQGDVLLQEVDEDFDMGTVTIIPPSDDGHVILALGEATGHHHSFRHRPGIVHFRDTEGSGGTYVSIKALDGKPTEPFIHQEHTAIPVNANKTLRVIRQRVYTSGMARRVAD